MRALSVRQRKPVGTHRFRRRPGPYRDMAFELFVELLRVYVARNGHARVPVRHREGNFCLGRWVTRCRRRYRERSLSPERIHALERLPDWSWDPTEERFQRALRLLWAFARREGHARVLNEHREGGFPLGSWVQTRRLDYKHGHLSRERVAALEALPGWSWRPHEDDFQEGLSLVREFTEREGHSRVPDLHEESGFALGTWVRTRRRDYKLGCLSPARIRLLERMPSWRWDHWEKEFEQGLRQTRRFAKREGHARVPARHYEGDFPLGSWVNNRRAQYRRGQLSREQARVLGALPGWKWRLRRRRPGKTGR